MRYTTDYYISNCLIEATKAKIKDWKNVKLKVFLPSFAGSLHFAWSDGKHDYEFISDTALPPWQAYTLFKGRLVERRVGTFDKLIKIQKKENGG